MPDNKFEVKLKDHVIVCADDAFGLNVLAEVTGRFMPAMGSAALERTRKATFVICRRACVLLSANKDLLEAAESEFSGIHCIYGDPGLDESMRMVNLRDAFGIFPACADFKDNLLITLSARRMKPDIRVVASNPEGAEKTPVFKRSGADAVASPALIGGMRLASEVSRPVVTEFLDSLLHNRESEYQIVEARMDIDSPYCGKQLRECPFSKWRLQALAVYNEESGKTVYNPGPSTRLGEGDVLLVLGGANDIARLSGMMVCTFN